MSGVKGGIGGLQVLQAQKIAPDEIDSYVIYNILKPGTALDAMGTKDPSSDGTAELISRSGYPDYPRNLLVTHDANSTVGGTLIVYGKNQFGSAINESFGITNAAGTRSQVAGTKVFGYVGSAVWESSAGTGNVGTVSIGFVQGTANNPKFGLPVPISGTTDLIYINWLDNGVTKAGSVVVDTTYHAVINRETGGVVSADDYIVWFRPTKDMSNFGQQTLL